MVRTTTELMPLLASLVVAAPGWAFEPCAAVSGDTLRCGGQVVRVRGIEAARPGTEHGDLAFQALRRKVREGRVRLEPIAFALGTHSRVAGPALIANVYVSEVRIAQRHIGPLPPVDVTDCDVVGANSLRCGSELLRIRGIAAGGSSQKSQAAARARLARIMQSGEVKFVRWARDHYGRVPVDLYIDGARVRCGVRPSAPC